MVTLNNNNMKKFIKLTGTDEGLLAENLVNIGNAVAIQFTGIQACRVYYQYVAGNNATMLLSGIPSGIPILMDSFEKAITANPGKVVVDLESKISTIEYTSN